MKWVVRFSASLRGYNGTPCMLVSQRTTLQPLWNQTERSATKSACLAQGLAGVGGLCRGTRAEASGARHERPSVHCQGSQDRPQYVQSSNYRGAWHRKHALELCCREREGQKVIHAKHRVQSGLSCQPQTHVLLRGRAGSQAKGGRPGHTESTSYPRSPLPCWQLSERMQMLKAVNSIS